MEFKKYKLRDLGTVDISGIDKKSYEGEKPVRLCNFTDVYKNWAITKYHYPTLMKATAKDRDIEKFKIRKGQVAITKDSETRDDIGIPTYIADDFDDVVLGYHCALITPGDALDGQYLNAYLNTKMAKKYFEGYASGSGQRYTLTLDSINDIQIWLPDTRSQKRISKILSDIDRKIALNTRMNAELEAMAKQLYDYWFVQFDFPDENGNPYKSSGGKMVYNPTLKREIPEHWEVKRLSMLMEYSGGSQPPASEFISEKKDGYIRFVQIRDYYTDSHLTYIPVSNKNKICNETDIMIARYGASLGRICYGLAGAYNVALAKVFPKKQVYKEFLRTYLKSSTFYDKINTIGTRCAQAGFNSEDVQNIEIVMPRDETIIENFSLIMEHFFCSELRNNKQNKYLTHLRDSLLPMLMNGQVTVE